MKGSEKASEKGRPCKLDNHDYHHHNANSCTVHVHARLNILFFASLCLTFRVHVVIAKRFVHLNVDRKQNARTIIVRARSTEHFIFRITPFYISFCVRVVIAKRFMRLNVEWKQNAHTVIVKLRRNVNILLTPTVFTCSTLVTLD